MISMRGKTILFIAVLLPTCPVGAQRPFFDRTHPSKVLRASLKLKPKTQNL